MPRIRRRALAVQDTFETWDYIAEDSVAAADRWAAKLDEKLAMLVRTPGLGRSRQELAPGLRSFPVGRYIVYYRAVPDGIELVRVLHSARDFAQLPWDEEG